MLEDERATVVMLAHYPTAKEARAAVDPFLRAWEIEAGLRSRYQRQLFRFEFDRAELIERAPSPGEIMAATLEGTTRLSAALSTAPVTLDAYAPAPIHFVASPDVETLWYRWEQYRAKREPLQAMAYVCLSILEVIAGGRGKVAKRYGISRSVLSDLGKLTSEVGDLKTGRKADVLEPRPLTQAESTWIQEVVKAMIRRVGERDFDPHAPLPQLTMAHFPPK